MDIYVGNLPYTATEEDVSGLFAEYGPVERVKIITDRDTGQSKGFAFVTLGDQSQLNAAIEALKDSKKQMKGAKLNLAQVTSGLVKAVSKQPVLAQIYSKAAPKFEYQSNDIISTLEDLLATFKSMKKDLDVEEFDINSAFEKNKLALSNEQKFAEKDRAEKEAIVEGKTSSPPPTSQNLPLWRSKDHLVMKGISKNVKNHES